MANKVPLFDKNNAKPNNPRPAIPAPASRPRDQRSSFEKARDERLRRERNERLFKWVILAAILVGLYYGYRYINRDAGHANDRYALMEKFIIKPVIYKHPTQRTALGRPASVVYPPQYVYVCLGDITRENYYIVVDEDIYYDYPLRTIFESNKLERFQAFESMDELKEYFSKRQPAPVAEEEKTGGMKNVVKNIKDFFAKIGS